MPFTYAEFITWLIIGLFGGTAAGIVVRRQRKGFGVAVNLALGTLGAIVGGTVFHVFEILPKLDAVSLSLRDLLSASSAPSFCFRDFGRGNATIGPWGAGSSDYPAG
jgi:uncharacterized membrane protein YeaQ/YmgE (transglycosylase-associated protein family)